MKSVLICPAERAAVARLAEVAPLVNLPILGESLVEYWLEHLAARGAKEVRLLAVLACHAVLAAVDGDADVSHGTLRGAGRGDGTSVRVGAGHCQRS